MAVKTTNALYNLWKDSTQGGLSNTRYANNSTELIWLDNLLNLLISQEKWTFPEEYEELQGLSYYIGSTLQMQDCMVLFKEKTTGRMLFLQATPIGTPTITGDYEQFTAFGRNGQTFNVKRKDCAVCWNTVGRTLSSGIDVTTTALRIADIVRTADVRLLNHKSPLILNMSEEQKASYSRYMKRLLGNEQYVAIYDDEFKKPIVATPNDIGWLNDELYGYISLILNQFLNRHGVNGNPETNKKSRLIVDEVNSNNEFVMTNRSIYTIPRIEFTEEAKRKFGIDIKYEFRINSGDLGATVTDDFTTQPSGGENNGNVSNNS